MLRGAHIVVVGWGQEGLARKKGEEPYIVLQIKVSRVNSNHVIASLELCADSAQSLLLPLTVCWPACGWSFCSPFSFCSCSSRCLPVDLVVKNSVQAKVLANIGDIAKKRNAQTRLQVMHSALLSRNSVKQRFNGQVMWKRE